MIPVDGGDEKQRAHSLVEVALSAPIGVELGHGRQQLRDRAALAPVVHRAVAVGGVGGCDDLEQAWAHAT
jgi:hypothetical protein